MMRMKHQVSNRFEKVEGKVILWNLEIVEHVS